MPETKTLPAAEFQSIPLDYLIATPLMAAVNAQKLAAITTRDFILSFLNKEGGVTSNVYTPQTVSFKLNVTDSGANPTDPPVARNVQLDVPLLSMVPVPHLRIDSLTTHFKYEISEIVKGSREQNIDAKLDVKVGTQLLPFLNASLSGNVSSRSAEESTTNRSGVLEVTVHASEAPIPEGLARLLNLLGKMAEPKAIN
jgi:hypothetical protein